MLCISGRLFVLFDGSDLVGKWPPELRSELRATIHGVRAFMDEDDSPEAGWLRVPLASVSPARAIDLALSAAEYVHTRDGAPKRRHLSSRR